MISEIMTRAVNLATTSLQTLHPLNFIKNGSRSSYHTIIKEVTSGSVVPSIIKNNPTPLATAANATASLLTVPPQDQVMELTLFSGAMQFEELPSVGTILGWAEEFIFAPRETMGKYFTIPVGAGEALLVLTLAVMAFSIIAYTVQSFFRRAIFGQSNVIPIQVLDVAVFDGTKPHWRVANATWLAKAVARFNLHQDEIKFMKMITERSGIGPSSNYSPGIIQWPADLGFAASRQEAEVVMYHCIDKLMAHNNIRPEDIDIVVTNCSLFNPTPSMASMIVNHYKLRTDVQSFHLGGMGCGISPLSVNVASSCLRLHPKKHPIAIVVSMETITPNIYNGRERAFMLQNALFRIGGAAVLLTRDSTAVLGRPMPKWTIEHSNHVHTASNTDAYTCVFQDIDSEERQGVRLDKALMSVAAGAITKNLMIVGPKILPISAKLEYVYRLAKNMIQTKIDSILGRKAAMACKQKPIVPNFRLAVQHFCVHAGGRAVLTAIQESLSLTDADMKPSRDTLYTYGNTSSSSIWYEYTQVEKTRRPRKGDIMLLIAVGSGFKANLLCLKALRDIQPHRSSDDQ